MKVAVTGAAGLIGGNICRALSARGCPVKALIYRDMRAVRDVRVETTPGDILDSDSLDRLLTGVDAVIHAAARISIRGDADGAVFRTNVAGTRAVVAACRRNRVRRLVHFSSIDALQHQPQHESMDETRPLVGDAASAYARSKALAETEIMLAADQGVETITLNPTAVLGPFDFKPSHAGQALIALHNRALPALTPGGFDWVDVRDVAAAAVQALEHGRSRERYILSGRWASLRTLAAMVAEISGKPAPRFTAPFWLALAGLPVVHLASRLSGAEPLFTRESLTLVKKGNRNISHRKASRELAFSPRPLNVTVADTLAWFKQTGMIPA